MEGISEHEHGEHLPEGGAAENEPQGAALGLRHRLLSTWRPLSGDSESWSRIGRRRRLTAAALERLRPCLNTVISAFAMISCQPLYPVGS